MLRAAKASDYRSTISRQTWGYVVAIAAVLTALLLKLAISTFVDQEETPFLLFSSAIMLSAWYGGWKPGMVATLFAAFVVNWYFLPFHHMVGMQQAKDWARLIMFLVEGGILCTLAGALHRIKHLAAHRAAIAEAARGDALARETDLRRVRNEITARDEMFRRLVDANVVGVMMCDLNGQIFEANNAFLAMIEYTHEDLDGGCLNWRRLTSEHHADLDEKIVSQLHDDGRFDAVEQEYVSKSGRRVPIWMAGAAMAETGRVVCFVMDLTAQKRAAAQLLEAKEAAERANRARGEFLANVSHELRTPMNAILGMTDLALDEQLPPTVRDYLETSVDSARTLLYLLNDLLDFSRIESGRIDFETVPFSLRNTLDQAMKILSLRSSEKGLELACSIAADVPDGLVGDQGRLRQILLNLVGNAIKFTEQGEVVVDVRLGPDNAQDGNEVQLLVSVSDTGIGISEEDQKRIFEPFTQVDATSTRAYGGTGLGLAITGKLVEQMRGSITVESELGRGTTFRVNLYLVRAEQGQLPPYQDIHRLPEVREIPVLVIDDNQTNQRILAEMLANWSMNPVAVGDGREALRLIRKAKRDGYEFPLILVDALMPSMDGFDFVEAATREGLLHGAAILMVSSTDRKMFEHRLKELPIAGFLEKPVSQSDLLDSVMSVLNQPVVTNSNVDRATIAPHPVKVLVAEDTRANQKVVEAILKKRGHVVTIAQNGREAIDLVRRQDFDVVLMDVQMPIVDGWQATQAIRRLDDAKANIPVLAMTAHAMRGDREKCLAVGMDDYIAKPLDAAELIHQVERLGLRSTEASQEENGMTNSPSNRDPLSDEPAVEGFDSEPETLVDRRAALDRLGNDVSLLQDMALFYIEDAPPLLATIRTRGRDSEATRAAHSLKGLASNFGARPLVEAAAKLEKALADGSDAEQLIETVDALSDRLSEELRDLIDSTSSKS